MAPSNEEPGNVNPATPEPKPEPVELKPSAFPPLHAGDMTPEARPLAVVPVDLKSYPDPDGRPRRTYVREIDTDEAATIDDLVKLHPGAGVVGLWVWMCQTDENGKRLFTNEAAIDPLGKLPAVVMKEISAAAIRANGDDTEAVEADFPETAGSDSAPRSD